MEIKKIIVDELPNSCRECDLMVILDYVGAYWCSANKQTISRERNNKLLRPSWCPLEVEEECVWSGNYGGEDENGDRVFFSKKTSCSDVHIQTVNIPDYKFCPNCGKRIKYAESEER